ncbi:UDP-glucosyltransferase 2-like [Athalia rosae]|uniref:UDP-glucosyltransferase 2-like n=1 Tax=Athalia rosae TaxID=37344 RepID=UPI002033B91D|nr:UDP-glucosyltransferase 2-like [Athalia rosae]
MKLKMRSKFWQLFFVYVMCFARDAKGARILGLFPLPAISHFNVFTEVMKSLADAGHQVDVVSHFPRKKPYPNYTDVVNLESETSLVFVNNLDYDTMAKITRNSASAGMQFGGIAVCDMMEQSGLKKLIENPPKDPPYDLVIVEFFVANCYFAFGRHLDIPIIALGSGSPMLLANEALGNPLNPAIVFEISEQPIFDSTFWQRLKNTIGTIMIGMEMRYHTRKQNSIVKKYFGSEMPDVDVLARDISLLLINSHHIFHGIRPLTPAVVPISGIHMRDDEKPALPVNLKNWLDESEDGFVYMSFGSMVKIESFPKPIITEMYEAFDKIAPLNVLVKIANPHELPPGLPKNVLTLRWAPQIQVLKHKNIRAFITHGGLGGCLESLRYAVPLIGVPLFADQFSNIDAAVHRGIAVRLDHEKLTADKIIEAVKSVVHDTKYKNNMIKLSKEFLDRPKSPRETSVFWIEYILKHGGDSLRSPAVKLTWWQVELIDVYAFTMAIILLTFYVAKLTIFMILKKIFNANETTKSSKKRD